MNLLPPDYFDSAMKRYCFEKISEDEVGNEMRARTKDVIEFVSRGLGIPSIPGTIWLRPVSPSLTLTVLGASPHRRYADEIHPQFARVPGDIRGGYTPRAKQLHQIWLRSDLSAYPDLEYVAAHETRHIWQKDNDFDLFDDECRAEGDAHPYASDALKRYLAEKGCLSREIEEDINKKREGKRTWFERCWPNGRFEIVR